MKDYFCYWPAGQALRRWGCAVTAAGYTRVQPGSPYPPQAHPLDHHFAWSSGRVLQCYQIVFIAEGCGWFETENGARQRIVAGTVFFLLPGLWHRYAPDPERGWVEHWLECRGPVFDRARREGRITAEAAVRRTGIDVDVLTAFERLHRLVAAGGPKRADALATLALHVLALLDHAVEPTDARRLDPIIERAQHALAARCHEQINVEQLARELGVSYSSFRRAFRAAVGLSPKQYQVELRLQKAQHLLANTDRSIKEIAALLNFDTAFHLSRQFKEHTGLSPAAWRKRT